MKYNSNMAMIHEQMLVDEYINSVLELDEQQFDEYFDSLSLEQQEELTEIIGKIAKGIGKIAVAPITLPYKVGKAAVKGVAKVATSNPVKKAAGMAAKGAGAIAKGIGKAAKAAVVNKQGNVRVSTAGRADAAAKKADRIAKRNTDRERLSKEKERLDKERQRSRDMNKQAMDREKQSEALDDDDKETIKPIIKALKKSVTAHDKQAKQLTKDIQDDFEPLEEFTDKQIERLRKEYEDLRGKETGINPEKFKKLRGMMKRFPKANLLKLVKADIPVLTTGAKAALVIHHGMKWKQLPEDFLPYIEIFADDTLLEAKKSNFKSVDPKVVDRIEKMMNGSRAEKDSIANMLNYLMPPEVVDMVRYKLKIVPKRGKIKFR